ncbi:hypothetical protein N7481_010343 [Penicillium waksmanii]|uniref:uncharacterized protein n=1 Tax=Penicillium waksmanii TaxID=69791 RepID=UPI0025468B41|nr:uncharacterized protein N7481_010343 [Penicillium waksmanii]KAJ5976636.1 hypothetical protein N7481_010343 [Penicillium waksmanii]
MYYILREYCVLKDVAKNSGLGFICVACDLGFRDQDVLYRHFDTMKGQDNVHNGLSKREGDFPLFLDSYRIAMGWETISDGDFPIEFNQTGRRPGRRPFYTFFEIEFVLEKKGEVKFNTLEKSLAIVGRIVRNAEKDYLCPLCLLLCSTTKAFYYHCDQMEDEVHTGLAYKGPDCQLFLPHYFTALKATVPEKVLPLGRGRQGAYSFHECFRLEFVMRWKQVDSTKDLGV